MTKRGTSLPDSRLELEGTSVVPTLPAQGLGVGLDLRRLSFPFLTALYI